MSAPIPKEPPGGARCGPQGLSAKEVRWGAARPHPGILRKTPHRRDTAPLHPGVGTGPRTAGREQGLDPQAPVQVRLRPRGAAVRVHFGILVVQPLQHFLADESQADQEGLVVKVPSLLSERVLGGRRLVLRTRAMAWLTANAWACAGLAPISAVGTEGTQQGRSRRPEGRVTVIAQTTTSLS